MYVVVNRITVAQGKADEFEATFGASMRDHLPDVPGLRRSTLMRPKNPDDPFMSLMEFEDSSSFHAWVKSESFRVAHDVAVDLTTSSTIEIYELVENVTA